MSEVGSPSRTDDGSQRQLSSIPPQDAQALLDEVPGPAPGPEAEVIVSEILALRKILFNLLCGGSPGEPLSDLVYDILYPWLI